MQEKFWREDLPYLLIRYILPVLQTLRWHWQAYKTRYRWLLLASPFLLFFSLNYLYPLPSQPPYSQMILARDSTVLHVFLSEDEKWRFKTELEEITPNLRQTLIHKEDRYFYYHFGVNPLAIIRAAFYNLLYFKTTSGASTITMQVARLLEPKSRTYFNKLWEVFRALQLEIRYSKEEILQLYLNLVPYGSNIEGVKAAALLYFDRLPHQLSLAQVVALTIIPNRPNSLTPGLYNQRLRQARNRWLKRLRDAQVIPQREFDNAFNEPLDAYRHEAPQQAPHWAYRLRQLYPDKLAIHSSLTLSTQKRCELIARDYLREVAILGIYNLSVLVVDNRNQEVIAYLGSGNFEDKIHSGEVDGIQAIRSPGSTLKPFLYGLAIEKGLYTPRSVLLDVPQNIEGFSPENFYKLFQGKVRLQEALVRSLNTTAVNTLEKIGVLTLIDALSEAGFRQISQDRDKLGLSMILGGCGSSLEELVGLYNSFARQGKYQGLDFLRHQSKNKGRQILSPETAYMISEMLASAQRPDLPSGFDNNINRPKIAWKTGTSYGRRDAWSIGYNRRYTVGVWLGNFSGEGVDQLVGAKVATPLLFKIFDALEIQTGATWFVPPKQLKTRLVCNETGLPPNHFCKHTIRDYYLPLKSSVRKCEHLQKIAISLDGRMSYCLTCRPSKGYQYKMFPNLPANLKAFYDQTNEAYEKVPPHNPACTRINTAGIAPKILSPLDDRTYIINRKYPPKMSLRCQADNDVERVYWYIDGKFHKEAPPSEEVFFRPRLGRMKIECSDDKGRSTSTYIKVLYE